MRRTVSTLALAGLAVLSNVYAADQMPAAERGRVTSLYARHAHSDHLLLQTRLAAGAQADRAEVLVTMPGGARAAQIARVPAELALAPGDEVEIQIDPGAGLGTRADLAQYKVTRLLTPRSQSVAAPAAQLAVVTEDGRVFIRAVGGAASATMIAADDSRVAGPVRAGPAPVNHARASAPAE